MTNSKQIICMGNGAYMGGDLSYLDAYVIAQANKKEPKVCLLATASGDNFNLISSFMKEYQYYSVPSYVSLWCLPPWDIHEHLLEQDIIVVPGGNTKSMLGLWKEYGVDKTLKTAYENGVILSGGSAGGVAWFDNFITDTFPNKYVALKGLGLIRGSFAPHYSSQRGRREEYMKHITEGFISSGYGVDDFAALHFKDDKLFKVVSEFDDAMVYPVFMDNGRCVEEIIIPEYLAEEENANKYIYSSPIFLNG